MRGKTLAAVCIAVLLVAVTVASLAKMLLNDLDAPPTTKCNPCEAASEAAARGMLVCRLSAMPATLRLGRHTINIEEAWIEEASELKHHLAWVPYYEPAGYRYICIRTDGDLRTYDTMRAWFHLENGEAFAGAFSEKSLFYIKIDEPTGLPIDVTVKVDSWDRPAWPTIRFTLK